MNAKEWLSRAMHLDKEIDVLLESKEKAFAKACSTTTHLQPTKVQHSKTNQTERQMARYAAYAALADESIDRLIGLKQETLHIIQTLEDSILRTILIARYINFKTWEQIAEDINYSCMHVTRLHNKALHQVQDVLTNKKQHAI